MLTFDDAPTPPEHQAHKAATHSTKLITSEIAELRKTTVTHRWFTGVMGGLALAVLGGGWVLTRSAAADAVEGTEAKLEAHKQGSAEIHTAIDRRVATVESQVERAANNSAKAADSAAEIARKVDDVSRDLRLFMEETAPLAAAKARAQKRADGGTP
jgi:methyl-accepting chemotaxis protein